MTGWLKDLLKQLPAFRRLARERDELREENDYLRLERDQLKGVARIYASWVHPGHFYSPIPSLEEVRRREGSIFGPPPWELPGIDLNKEEQLAVLDEAERLYPELPFGKDGGEAPPTRFTFANKNYTWGDAIFLYCMLRRIRPRRIIEVGSGGSSCAMLDVNDLFFDGAIECAFIDPEPELLRELVRPGDLERHRMIEKIVQEVNMETFDALEAGDVLFIDSTHVAKVGGDVNHLIFSVLPRLKPGVFIHFHDVFYPFEYPKKWIYKGMAWNEAYLLRAFLQYNPDYRIVCFYDYLATFHRERLRQTMPLCLNHDGANLWLRKGGERSAS